MAVDEVPEMPRRCCRSARPAPPASGGDAAEEVLSPSLLTPLEEDLEAEELDESIGESLPESPLGSARSPASGPASATKKQSPKQSPPRPAGGALPPLGGRPAGLAPLVRKGTCGGAREAHLSDAVSLTPVGRTVCFSQSVRGHDPNSCALYLAFMSVSPCAVRT